MGDDGLGARVRGLMQQPKQLSVFSSHNPAFDNKRPNDMLNK